MAGSYGCRSSARTDEDRCLQVTPLACATSASHTFLSRRSAFVAGVYESIRTDEAVPGLPTIDDGVAAVALTEAVLTSHAAAALTDVSSH